MSKIFLSFFFCLCSLFAANGNDEWAHQHRFTLKKDELAHVSIATTESKGEDKSSFYFRWTLKVKDKVTTLINHKGYPHQVVLYKKRSLDRVRFDLLNRGANQFTDATYLLLVLSDINQSEDEVDFDIFIKDNKKRILVEFDPQKEDKAE